MLVADLTGTFSTYYTTEVIKDNLNPYWKEFTSTLAGLIGAHNDFNRNIKFEVWDWDLLMGDEKKRFIGSYEISYSNLLQLVENDSTKNSSATFALYDWNGKETRSEITIRLYKSMSMKALVRENRVVFRQSVAIDFSNHNSRTSPGLHYFTSGVPVNNEYSFAIRTAVDVLNEFDPYKLYNVYGFRGHLWRKQSPTVPGGVSQDAWDLNSSAFDINQFFLQMDKCQLVDGVVQAYATALPAIFPGKQCNFAPVIRLACDKFRTHGTNEYGVLFLFTQGTIDDMKATKLAIEEAAKLRMSIIIVGVGKGNFPEMDELDADETPLMGVVGNVKIPDITQFFAMDKFMQGLISPDPVVKERTKVLFRIAVLEELPREVRKREEIKLKTLHGF